MNNKQKILDLISISKCPLSAKDILESISWIDKTTVYRNLEKLLSWEKLIEDFSISWEKLYSLKENHHHHFVCDICKKTENIWCFLDIEIDKLQNKFNFKVKNHVLVLSWICKDCI